ncbi:protein phosphatase 2C domain-containing protein [Streptosporangium sp. NPDC004631]
MFYLIATSVAITATLIGGVTAYIALWNRAVFKGKKPDLHLGEVTPPPEFPLPDPAPPLPETGRKKEAGQDREHRARTPNLSSTPTVPRVREKNDGPVGGKGQASLLPLPGLPGFPDWGGPLPFRTLHFDAAGRTNGGEYGENTGGFLLQDELIAVADGISDTGKGRRASALALGAVVSGHARDPLDPVRSLEESLDIADDWLRDASGGAETSEELGAHLSVAAISQVDDVWMLTFAQAGDGVIYVFSQPDMGRMLANVHVSKDDPARRATSAHHGSQGDAETFTATPGALVVIATAGFADALSFSEVQAVIRRNFETPPHLCAGALLDAAYRRCVATNITVAVARVTEVTGYGWDWRRLEYRRIDG